MSEIKSCPGCNRRKRKLYKWKDEEINLNIDLCEDCIFIREFEKELLTDLENEDYQKVLIDYEAFNSTKAIILPYRWLSDYICLLYFDGIEFIDLEKIKALWNYQKMDLEEDIIPKFISLNLLSPMKTLEKEGKIQTIYPIGTFIKNLIKSQRQKANLTGENNYIPNVLKIIDGRIGFAIETKTRYKDKIRWKLIKFALKYGFESDGSLKEEAKLKKISHFKCKLCDEIKDIRYHLFQHLSNEHPEIQENLYDQYAIEENELIGIKIPRKDIASLNEIKTYGSAWRRKLIELFKKEAFFSSNSSNEFMIIQAPWARVLELVNKKVKNKLKVKEKFKIKK